MNKVYRFTDPDQIDSVYVAAPTFKEAKKIALKLPLCQSMDKPFTQIRGHMVRKDGQPVLVAHEGELAPDSF